MHLRTAQFLLYHAKVEGVVEDVSTLSNPTDYSDKKLLDAWLFCFRWRRPKRDNLFPPWCHHDRQSMYTIFLHSSLCCCKQSTPTMTVQGQLLNVTLLLFLQKQLHNSVSSTLGDVCQSLRS